MKALQFLVVPGFFLGLLAACGAQQSAQTDWQFGANDLSIHTKASANLFLNTNEQGNALVVGGKRYRTGFSVRGSSTLEYNLAGQCRSFYAEFGATKNLDVKIFADGQLLHHSNRPAGQVGATPAQGALKGVRTLSFVVNAPSDTITYIGSPKVNCGELSDMSVAATDTQAPQTDSVYPWGQEVSASYLAIAFDEAIDPASLRLQITPALLTDTEWPTDTYLKINPQTVLQAGTVYTVTYQAKDLAGNNLSGMTNWSFSTAASAAPGDTTAPKVVSVYPYSNTNENRFVSVSFDEAINAQSLQLSSSPALRFSAPDWTADGRWFQVEALDGLAQNTTYTMTASAKDKAGNALSGYKWTFTTPTTNPTDTTPPALDSVVPWGQSIDTDTGIALAFSEGVVRNSLSLTLTPSANLESPTWTDNNRWVRYQPSAPLQAGTTYTVAVEAKDPAGNALSTGWSFRTAGSTSTTPAQVSGVSPWGTNIATNTNFAFSFSQAMQPLAFKLKTTPALSFNPPVWTDNKQYVSYTLASPMAAGTTYTVTLEGTDTNGNALVTGSYGTYTITTAGTTTPPPPPPPPPAAVPFKVEQVATGLRIPWAIAFTAPNRMVVTERPGTVVDVIGGVRRVIHTFGEVRIIDNPLSVPEEGLMGVAKDPNYSSNKYLYFCLAEPIDTNNNFRVKVVRMIDNITSLSFDRTVVTDIPGNLYHVGCRVAFGPDDKLYVTTGEAGARNVYPQDKNSLGGKTLRLNNDGSIPNDNPFGNAVWSYGHRNSQGITWTRFGQQIQTEHGPSSEPGFNGGGDEINLIVKGANYGWPICVYDCLMAGINSPLWMWFDNNPAIAPASAQVVLGNTFPQFKDNLLFGGLRSQAIWLAKLDYSNNTVKVTGVEKIVTSLGRVREVIEGPDGYIYVSTSNGDGRGTASLGQDSIYRLVPN